MANVYISKWGTFQIPDEVFGKTQFSYKEANKWDEFDATLEIVHGVKAVPENWHFFKWLDDEEIKAGKPCSQ